MITRKKSDEPFERNTIQRNKHINRWAEYCSELRLNQRFNQSNWETKRWSRQNWNVFFFCSTNRIISSSLKLHLNECNTILWWHTLDDLFFSGFMNLLRLDFCSWKLCIFLHCFYDSRDFFDPGTRAVILQTVLMELVRFVALINLQFQWNVIAEIQWTSWSNPYLFSAKKYLKYIEINKTNDNNISMKMFEKVGSCGFIELVAFDDGVEWSPCNYW